MNKPSKDFLQRLLVEAATHGLATDGVLDGAKVALYTVRTGNAEQPLYADFTQPTFTGYAISAAVTYGTPFYDDSEGVVIGADLKQFTCSGGTPDDEVIGAVIFTGAAASEKVLWYDEFPAAISISEVGEAIRYAALLRLAQDGDYGKGSLVS